MHKASPRSLYILSAGLVAYAGAAATLLYQYSFDGVPQAVLIVVGCLGLFVCGLAAYSLYNDLLIIASERACLKGVLASAEGKPEAKFVAGSIVDAAIGQAPFFFELFSSLPPTTVALVRREVWYRVEMELSRQSKLLLTAVGDAAVPPLQSSHKQRLDELRAVEQVLRVAQNHARLMRGAG